MRSDGRRDRGLALVAVLWVITLLALLAAGVGSSSRTELRLAYNAVERAKAMALADAGIHHALFALLTGDGEAGEDGSSAYRFALDGGGVGVLIRDEDGKIDVNAAPHALIHGLFLAVGLDDDGARMLADRILDFRDADSDAEPLGAEDADYVDAGRSEGAADRPFLAISEVADVLGMTGEIYRTIRPHITVFADADGIDPNRTTRTVLEALPGMTPEVADGFMASGPGDDPLIDLPADIVVDIEDYLLPSRELIFSIEAFAESERGGRFVREAIVALDGAGRALPATVHLWRRGTPEAADQTYREIVEPGSRGEDRLR